MQPLYFVIRCARPQTYTRVAKLVNCLLERSLVVWCIRGAFAAAHQPLICLSTTRANKQTKQFKIKTINSKCGWVQGRRDEIIVDGWLTRRTRGSSALWSTAKCYPLDWRKASWFCFSVCQRARWDPLLWAIDRISHMALLPALLFVHGMSKVKWIIHDWSVTKLNWAFQRQKFIFSWTPSVDEVSETSGMNTYEYRHWRELCEVCSWHYFRRLWARLIPWWIDFALSDLVVLDPFRRIYSYPGLYFVLWRH